VITVETVVTSLIDVGWTNIVVTPGVWHVRGALQVKGNTNAWVDTSAVGDGGFILIDQFGVVEQVNGPEVARFAVEGFGAGLLVVGLWLAVLRAIKASMRGANPT